MAYATNINTVPHGASASRLSILFSTLRMGLAKRKLYRSTLDELQSLSDRELADLGLHRSGLPRIAYQAAYDA